MAIQTVNGNKTGDGLQIDLGTDDSFFLGADGFLVNESTAAGLNENLIAALGSFQVVTILGTAYSYGDALLLGDAPDGDASGRIFIGEQGFLGSQTGVAAYLRCTSGIVENWGTIDGAVGIAVVSAFATDPTRIENHGLIRARSTDAIYLSSGGPVEIVNSGTIRGGLESALDATSSSGAISIVNTGTIEGMMQMGAGADSYDGRRGTLEGTLAAGGGDDTLKGGTGAEGFQGDGGRDILTGGLGADVFIYAAAGDSLLAKAGRDLITDFSHRQHDALDLSAFDLDFVGKSAFSGSNEVRFQIIGKSTFVYVNLDADQEAEMAIQCVGKIKFAQADFAL